MAGLGVGTYATGNIPTYQLFEPIFDGTFYLENSSPASLPINNEARSMFGWIKVPQPTTAQIIFGYGSLDVDDPHYQTEFTYNSRFRELGYYWNQQYSACEMTGDSTYVLSANTWYFVGMTYPGNGYIEFYCCANGRFHHQTINVTSLNSHGENIRIGFGMCRYVTANDLFIGNIEKVGIWNRALSVDEVQQYYNAGRVDFDSIPSEIRQIENSNIENAEARVPNLGAFTARSVIYSALQAATRSNTYNAVSFDGGTQIIINDASSDVNSISVWVKYGSETSNGPIIVKGNNDWNSFHWDWGIWADNGYFYFCVEPSAAIASISHNNDSWYHIVLIRNNSGTAQIYFNGNFMGNFGVGSNTSPYDSKIYIGGVGGQYIYGAIEEVQLFDYALSSDQVGAIYNNGEGVYGTDTSGLIGGYHFNNDLLDYSSNNNTAFTASIHFTTGIITNPGYKSAFFDGSSRITVSNAVTSTVNSISLWFKHTDGPYGSIIAKGGDSWDSNAWDWGIWHDGGTNLYVNVAPGAYAISFYYTYNTWYHVVLVRDDGEGQSHLYINGSMVGSASAGSSNDNAEVIRIGGSGYNFIGNIQEIQLFSSPLTYDNVTELYNSGNGVYGSAIDFDFVAGYHLNNDSKDYSFIQLDGVWSGNETYGDGHPLEATTKNIVTSEGYTLEALVESSLDQIETSNGSILQFSQSYIADIITSSGANLQFCKTDIENGGVVSFWNLTESSGTRYDSVGDNNLNEVEIVAAFNYSTPAGRGNPVAFTNTSPLADDYNWDFGDSYSSTSENPTHTFGSTGTFTVVLEINGGAQSVSHDIVIEEPVASFTTDSPVNFGSPVTFTDTSTYAISWYWDFGDGNSSTEQNPTHTYSSSGDFSVSLEINSNISNTSGTVTVNLAQSYIWDKVDLSDYFNMVGFIDDNYDATSLPAYGLDGNSGDGWTSGGYLMSITALGSSPQVFSGVEFNTPVSGQNSTSNIIRCTGQVIPLAGGKYSNIYMLGFITNAPYRSNIPFVVTYSDSSTDTFTLNMSDWFYGTTWNFANESVAKQMSYRLSGNGNASSATVYLHEYTLALNANKNAVSITMPNTPFTFIAAISQASLIVNPACWMKADTLSLNDGDAVSNWTDRSGNSHNMIQANSGSRPLFKTNIINGLPAIKFDGVNDAMQTSVTANNKYSVFAVYKESTTGNFSVAVSWGNGTGKTFWTGYIPDSSGTAYPGHLITASDSSLDNYATSADDTNWHVITGQFDGTHLTGRNFGISSTASAVQNSAALTGSTVTLGGYTAAGTLPWDGYIAEVLLFTDNVSSMHRQLIESYLIYKYGLQQKNEIQTFSFSPTPISGNYTITVDGQTSGNISYDATASNVDTALNLFLNGNISAT